MAKEVNDSRFQAGVYYKSDNAAFEELGKKSGNDVVRWAKQKVKW